VTLSDLLNQRRPHRADAARNFDAIIAEARARFTDGGTDVSLDDIARRAGVGPVTLYRHFPAREDLIEAGLRRRGRLTMPRRRSTSRDRRTVAGPGPKYGLQLREEFEAATGYVWTLNSGQVYTTIDRLQRAELIVRENSQKRGRQRQFRITAQGTSELKKWMRTLGKPRVANPRRICPEGADRPPWIDR
jgi:AcrR family transcriptional regulator